MLELTTDQCIEYVKKVATLVESAGCKVRVLMCTTCCAVNLMN